MSLPPAPAMKHGPAIPVRINEHGAPLCPDLSCNEPMVNTEPGIWRCPIAAAEAIARHEWGQRWLREMSKTDPEWFADYQRRMAGEGSTVASEEQAK